LLIAEVFRRQGYTPELSAAMGADGSVDLTLRRAAETILVQCTHWKMERVTEAELRAFYSAMTTSGAPRGVIVTMGTFTPGARTYAQGKSLELMDGSAVTDSLTAVTKPSENIFRIAGWIDDFISHARVFDPECPVCHGTMHVRHNRANGTPVWCCRSYPRCPGRREPRIDLLPATTY
jgi:restriction system protein